MAVGLRLDFVSLELADYDAVCTALNFPADWPDGLLSHASGEVDGKLCVYDVWESRAQFDQFVADRLGAAMGQALDERARAAAGHRESVPHLLHPSIDRALTGAS